MEIVNYIFNDFYENTYIIFDETGECVIVDAGCYTHSEKQELDDFIESNKLKIKYLLNTHCHIDHVLGLSYLKNKYNVPFVANHDDNYLIEAAVNHGLIYGFTVEQPPKPDILIKDKDTIKFGNSELMVLGVPGHTTGHVAFYSKNDKFVITGDVLFKGSIGRTDLPGGNYDVLMESIRTKLLTLPDDTLVYAGHGGNTTIGLEKRNNPFLE